MKNNNKFMYLLTCENCMNATYQQNPVHLTMDNSFEAVHDFPGLENTCEHLPRCPGKRCEWWKRKRFDKMVSKDHLTDGKINLHPRFPHRSL